MGLSTDSHCIGFNLIFVYIGYLSKLVHNIQCLRTQDPGLWMAVLRRLFLEEVVFNFSDVFVRCSLPEKVKCFQSVC